MIENQEIWKPVVGFEGIYEISSFGNIRKISATKFERKSVGNLVPYLNKFYLRIYLTGGGGKFRHAKIHRLVAEAFIPNPENKPQVNHINCIKTDNRVENLEWATNSDNQLHAYANGLQPKRNGGWVIKDKSRNFKAKRILNMETGERFLSIRDAADSVGMSKYVLSQSLRGTTKKDFGFAYATDI